MMINNYVDKQVILKRFIVFFFACLFLPSAEVTAQITINGHKPFFDKISKSLLFVTDENSLESLTASVVLDNQSSWTRITIDGKPLSENFDFGNATQDKTYKLNGLFDGRDSTLIIRFTNLPVLRIEKEGPFTDDYTPCKFTLDSPDTNLAISTINAKIKHRGRSTNTPDKHKRNYHIKLLNDNNESNDIPLLNMRKDDSWLLDAGQIDMFRMRNHILHELWLDFSTPAYFQKNEPKSTNGCHSQLVELFVNNEYRGLYSLMEPIDRKQLKLKKYKNGVKGVLWKATSWEKTTFYDPIDIYDNSSATCYGYEVKYPEPKEDADTTDYSTLVNAINFVVSSSDEDFKKHIVEYIDLPVFIDYVLFVQLINGSDNGGKNCYWSVYDKSQDKKITITPWDLDATVGQNWTNSGESDEWINPQNDLGPIMNIERRLEAILGPAYVNKRNERYRKLRENDFSEESLINRFKSGLRQITACGAASRETKKWSRDSDLGGKELDFESELNYISNWLHQRLIFLDNKYSYVSGIQIVNQKFQSDDKWYNLQGQPVKKPTKGIYIYHGKKVVIQ